MDKNYIYHLYQNLFKYLEYREKTIPVRLTQKEFNEKIDSDLLIIIRSDDIVIILTLPLPGKYAILGADGKRKIREIGIKSGPLMKEILYICDVNYIAQKSNTSLNTVSKIILELNSTLKDVWIQVRSYKTFELIIPECIDVSKHRIVDKDYVNDYLTHEHKSKTSLPQIHVYDPPIIWLGGRPGQYVEVDRYTSSVGMISIIRLIV